MNKRIIILPQDVATLFGCSYETARRKISLARTAIGKKPKAPVTIKEFCMSFDLPLKDVEEKIL